MQIIQRNQYLHAASQMPFRNAKKIIAKQGIKMSLSLTLFGIGGIQSIKEFWEKLAHEAQYKKEPQKLRN